VIRVLVIANIVVFGFIAICIPWFDNGWQYEGVGPAAGDLIEGHSDGPTFILREGGLYLLSTKLSRGIILVTGGQTVEWSEADIRELRRKHPEIDRDELWQKPEEIEYPRTFTHGRELRPEPEIRAEFDGEWTGRSGDTSIRLKLRDGLGSARVGRDGDLLDLSTYMASSGRVGFAVADRDEGMMFVWDAKRAGPDEFTVHRATEWQVPLWKYRLEVPFTLRRKSR
jgi:hypothetical protein